VFDKNYGWGLCVEKIYIKYLMCYQIFYCVFCTAKTKIKGKQMGL